MKYFIILIKSDYLQRTRSYAFLITLCVTLGFAYSFVPSPEANYSTIRIGNHTGEYNSAWMAYVTAIMTSMFVSLIGFYLVNSGIKKDIHSKVGQIIATTKVRNLTYLFSKMMSNFLVLLTIVLIVFLMSIGLFFMYNDGFSFEISDFILPYLLIPIPAIFFISSLAVVFEVVLGRFSILQNIIFFFLFSFLAASNMWDFESGIFDFFGTTDVMKKMELVMEEKTDNPIDSGFSIGFSTTTNVDSKTFLFEGIEFSNLYITSRFIWIVLGLVLIGVAAPLFHRFNTKEDLSIKKSTTSIVQHGDNDIELSSLPNLTPALGIYAFFKTEFMMLIRQGPKWLWLFNLGGIVALVFAPLHIAHQFILPSLWFLQVGRWSSLTTKEKNHNVHYFAFASYKPLMRLLLSQLLAGISIALILALPLLVRYSIGLDFSDAIAIALGGCFIVLLAATLGIVTQGKKLFEVLFFMVTYANLNAIPFLDYFGGTGVHFNMVLFLLLLNTCLLAISFGARNFELKRI